MTGRTCPLSLQDVTSTYLSTLLHIARFLLKCAKFALKSVRPHHLLADDTKHCTQLRLLQYCLCTTATKILKITKSQGQVSTKNLQYIKVIF